AVLWGGLCGLLPDLDMLANLADPWNGIVHHRAESHSLLVLPWVALALGPLAFKTIGKGRGTAWQWIHLSLWALLTHPLLDLCTSYGTQLLAPVSRERYALDAVSIIDP